MLNRARSVLRGEGRYATRTRERIIDLLERERRYLSAAATHRVLAAEGAKISLSTVYRTLDLLVGMGIASARTDADGEATYVYCKTAHHHHAICRHCGHVEEVDCGAMERFAKDLRASHSFELDAHSLEFSGTCARCQ